MSHHCHKCQAEVPGREFGRGAACPQCRADVHACLNCDHYDSGAHHECREPQAEWVREKDRGNFCDYFRFRQGVHGQRAAGAISDTKKKLDDLFKR